MARSPVAGPYSSIGPVVAQSSEVLGSKGSHVGFLTSGWAYIVLKTVQRPGVYSAAYGTVHQCLFPMRAPCTP